MLLADDDTLFAQSVSRWLATWYDVLDPVCRFDDLLPSLTAGHPDVLLLDLLWRRDRVNAISALPDICRAASRTAVVVVTGLDECHLASFALAEGAMGYLTKLSALSELRVAVEEVHDGRPYVSPVVLEDVIVRVPSAPIGRVQREVLRRKQAGLSNAAVARSLGRDVSVVGYHLRQLRKKLQLPGQVAIDWTRVLVPQGVSPDWQPPHAASE